MDADDEKDKSDGREQRVATGLAIGMAIGVALSVGTDNWGMIGVGMAIGIAIGAAPIPRSRKGGSEEGPTHD